MNGKICRSLGVVDEATSPVSPATAGTRGLVHYDSSPFSVALF